METSSKGFDAEQFWGILAKILFGAAVLSFLSGMVVSCGGGKLVETEINTNGGIAGPFEISEPQTICQLIVSQNLSYSGPNKWSFVEFELLDDEKEPLFGVGNELWAEEGRDSDGAWRERKTNYKANFIIREPGSYYLEASAEASGESVGAPIHVTLRKAGGSPVPLMWGAVVFLVLAILSFRQQSKYSKKSFYDDRQVRSSDF